MDSLLVILFYPQCVSLPYPWQCPSDVRVYQAIKDMGLSHFALADLHRSIESCLKLHDVETQTPLIATMT